VIPVEVHGDVNVEYVPVLEGSEIGYPVTYDLVDGRAAALGEFAVIERAGIRTPFDARIVHRSVISSGDFTSMSRSPEERPRFFGTPSMA